jgi:hypothetical protein
MVNEEDEKKEEVNVKQEEEEKDVDKKNEESAKEGEQNKNQIKELKKVFLIIGILSLFFLGIFFFINSQSSFEYKGVKFYIDKQTMNGKTLYRTGLPVDSNQKITAGVIYANYNFYFRKDPRILKNLPWEGDLTLMPDLVINFTGDLNCDGDGIIAIANLQTVLEVLDVSMIKDETAVCDPLGRYTLLQLQLGEETKIEQIGHSCYNLYVNNCEILEVTEKYIVEVLSEVTKNRLQ